MKQKVFYIFAPSNFASGGPELLHQLGAELKKRGLNSTMVYTPKGITSPVHENYREYKLEWTYDVPDTKDSVIILPEVFAELHKNFSRATIAIWWLSVDFYYLSSLNTLTRIINKILHKTFSTQKYFGFDKTLSHTNILHLTQSYYAKQHLISKNINQNNIIELTDYLHTSFLKSTYHTEKKQNIVAYNPKKGFSFTQKIIKECPDINFRAIENMSRGEVVSLLESAKLYIDFGFHPGKDRIPREAAHLGCCIIVGNKGSASNDKDVAIPVMYKLSNNQNNIDQICKKIREVINEYEACHLDFEPYRQSIKNEKCIFETQVDNLIKKLNTP